MKERIDRLLGYLEWSAFRASRRLRKYMHDPKLFFMHIPKTGGTSIKHGLYRDRKSWYDGHVDASKTRKVIRSIASTNSSRERYFSELFKLRQSLAARKLASEKPIITGHVPIINKFFSECSEYKFITVIRDPVERWMSDYRYSYSIGGLDSFFDGQVPEHPANGIKRALKSKSGKFQRNIYKVYFSGFGWGVSSPFTKDSKREAIKNIKKIDRVFLTEEMEMVKVYIEKNGIQMDLKSKNETESEDKKGEELKEEMEKDSVREEIKHALREDIEVYEAAREKALS